MVCRVTENGGTYYRSVASFTEHDFRACDGATPYPGFVYDLLDEPNVDRRCVLDSDSAIAKFHALVGVYSNTKSSNLAAARRFCSAHGGTR
jgi:hypothetical protein